MRQPTRLAASFLPATSLVLLLGIGCASTPSPPAKPPELLVPPPAPALEPLPPDEELAIAPPRATAPPAVDVAPADSHTVTVIEAGGGDAPPSLAEASRLAKSQRSTAPAPSDTVTITDKNLAEYATGELTYAAEKPVSPALLDGLLAGGQPEEWWRSEVRFRRQRWSDLVTKVLDLEERAAELRNRFYAEADPWHRDARIKPEWDRTLDLLVATRDEARLAEREVKSFVELGRHEDAPAGWLRAGLELEPVARPYDLEAVGPAPRPAGEPREANNIVGEPKTIDE